MKSKKRRIQVTCWCGAYSFPHRIGGGRCSGSSWAESYFYTIKIECENCISNKVSFCEVAMGIESISYCEAYENEFHYQTGMRLPQKE